jgi:hypothetical protein
LGREYNLLASDMLYCSGVSFRLFSVRMFSVHCWRPLNVLTHADHTHSSTVVLVLVLCPAGGEGGSVGVQQSFLAVINSSLVGTPPAGQAAAAAGGSSSAGRDAIRSIIMSAYTGEVV